VAARGIDVDGIDTVFNYASRRKRVLRSPGRKDRAREETWGFLHVCLKLRDMARLNDIIKRTKSQIDQIRRKYH
jgi:superfamily II DNA/RNA helicase